MGEAEKVSEGYKVCMQCGKTKRADKQFYRTNNLEKYPDGYLNKCKDCTAMYVDNFDPQSYLWILQEIDVPYIPIEWNKLLAKYGRDPKKITGLTILGRYLSKMRLMEFRDYRWADTEMLKKIENKKLSEALSAQGLSAAEIAEVMSNQTFNFSNEQEVPVEDFSTKEELLEAIKKGNTALSRRLALSSTEVPKEIQQQFYNTKANKGARSIVIPESAKPSPEPKKLLKKEEPEPAAPPAPQDYFGLDEPTEEEANIISQLTKEDKAYLITKWGRAYSLVEQIKLERLYNEMMNSFDIQTASHIDNLKKLCKVSLKSDQLLDAGDIEGAQKLLKVYDNLMKSGKFQAIQNKETKENAIDAVSQIAAICESKGFIPRFYTEQPQDKVDLVIRDYQNYVKSLVENETNMSAMIERALTHMKEDEQAKAENDSKDPDMELFDEFREADYSTSQMEPEDMYELEENFEDDDGGDE